MRNRLSSLMLSVLVMAFVGCGQRTSDNTGAVVRDNPLPLQYENEYFSINYPKNWTIDDSGWLGRDSMQNEIDLFPIPKNKEFYQDGELLCYIHCVKSSMQIQWENAKEAAEVSKTMKALKDNPDNLGIYAEYDSLEIDGYPTYLIMYAHVDNGDTICDKQYVTYLPNTHTVFYFNNNFLVSKWEEGQKLGDEIIKSIRFKKGIDMPMNNQDDATYVTK